MSDLAWTVYDLTRVIAAVLLIIGVFLVWPVLPVVFLMFYVLIGLVISAFRNGW